MLVKAVSFGTEDDTLSKLLEAYDFLIKIVLMKNERKLPRALEILDPALQVYPHVVMFHALRANVLTRLDRIPEALQELEIASNAQYISPMVHFNYGLIYVHQGAIKKAQSSFQNALRMKPDYHEARMELGRVNYWSGLADKEEAENM